MITRPSVILGLILIGLIPATSVAQPPERPASCLKNAKFQVVYRQRIGSSGSVILVQRLRPDQPPRWCFFKRQPGDFNVGGPGDDKHVLGLSGNVLVLDRGTGPLREIAFFDLESRDWLRSEPYDAAAPVKVAPGAVAFSAITGPASEEMCPEFKTYMEKGLEAALAQDAVVSLPSGEMALSGPTRCIGREQVATVP